MIKRAEYLERFWEPYLMSEREFLNILEYVALRESNFHTCSERLIRNLFTSSVLFESLVKAIYDLEEGNIGQYKEKLLADPEFVPDASMRVLRGETELTIAPFSALSIEKSPEWWKAYTDLKHNRAKNFEAGNLENALNALGGVCYLSLLYVRKVGDYWYERLEHSNENCLDVPNDVSHLFRMNDFETRRHLASFDSYFASNEEISELFNSHRSN